MLTVLVARTEFPQQGQRYLRVLDVLGGGGVFAAALEYCSGVIGHLRIDTHADNKPMQHVVEKAGFSKRGIIYVEDGTPRIAYDRI